MMLEYRVTNFVQGGRRRLDKGSSLTPGEGLMSRDFSWQRGGLRVLSSERAVGAKAMGLETIQPLWGRVKELSVA